MQLAEPVGAVDPVSTALVGPGILGVHAQREPSWLPRKVKSESVGARILQELLKGSSYLNPRTGEEDANTPAGVAIGLQVVVVSAHGRRIDCIVKAGFGVCRKSAAQHHAIARFGGQRQNQ